MTTRDKVNRLLAVVLVVWGGGVVLSGLARGLLSAEDAYSAGQLAAFVFGFVMVIAGLRTLHRKRPS